MRLSKKLSAAFIACALLALITMSCNKYDKMSIVGTYEIDIKEALSMDADSCKESLTFDSGNSQKFTQNYELRNNGKYTRYTIDGNFERKHNKLTFYNQKKDDGSVVGDLTYKYRIEDNKLILKVDESEGYSNGEKIYTKKTL